MGQVKAVCAYGIQCCHICRLEYRTTFLLDSFSSHFVKPKVFGFVQLQICMEHDTENNANLEPLMMCAMQTG
jgi:hypothetical protein